MQSKQHSSEILKWKSSWNCIFITILRIQVKVIQSCLTLRPHGYSPWNSLGQNTGVGSLSLPQGILLIPGLNPGLPHCRRILYQLSHKGSPNESENCSVLSDSLRPHGRYSPGVLQARILECVAGPFSRGSSQPRGRTGVSCIAGGFFTNWAIREAH